MRVYLTLFARPENLFWPSLHVGAEAKGDITRWLTGAQFWAGWTPAIYLTEPLTPADVTVDPGGVLRSFTERAQKVVRAMQELARREKAKLITVAPPPSIDEAVSAPKQLRLTRGA